MANISLKEAAQIMERDHGYTIKIGNFGSFDEFLSYFNIHYKPLLERWQQGDADRLMGFFIDDMLSAFDPTNEG